MCHRKFFCLMMICFVGLSFGCMASAPPEESMADVSTVAATRIPAMATSSATPSLTPMPTSTATPPPTIQPTATEIPFVIPTPPGNEVREQSLWLLETNNGCLLPCWWGITLGETEWTVAEEFLNRFDRVLYGTSSVPGNGSYEATIPLSREVFIEDETQLHIGAQNGIVDFIQIHLPFIEIPPGYLTNYTLSTFLTTYGQPTEVWLSTYSAPQFNELPFVAVLFYHDQGIAALYGDNGVKQGDIIHGCPQQEPVRTLELWLPSLDITFETVNNGSAAFNGDFLSLEEATEMDVATFYETFKNPDNTTCLETPADLWR